MDVRITPRLLRGAVAAPPSKSHAQRVLLCAALSDAPCEIFLGEPCADVTAMATALCTLGARLSRTADGYAVRPMETARTGAVLDCGESGAVLRFLLPVTAAVARDTLLTGHGRLPARPIGPLADALRAHGCAVDCTVPIARVAGGLRGGAFCLPGDVSSQFTSGLLLALPLCAQDSTLTLTAPPVSRGYVRMTLEVLRTFGVSVAQKDNVFEIPGRQRPHAAERVAVEGDWSAAAFWLAAEHMGGSVSVSGLPQQTTQGDAAMPALLRAIGRGGACVDLRDVPDLAPALAVAACAVRGETVFCGAERLRLKESDRASAICALLRALGGKAEIEGDTLRVYGTGSLRGGTVDSAGDHRIAMAAAVASVLCREPVVVRGADAVQKSYPRFWDDFTHLGGKLDVL